jgi:adenylate cyclase
MTTRGFKRKLTAIFSADVAGYSRLMGLDEVSTVERITTYRKVMSELIKQHRGRVVDSPGDNLLGEFSSVVDAVQCAVAVQKELKARNAELPEDRRMQFRVGVNLGDVIEEEGRIYGDGVNIAARLEALAPPGGICISKTAFEHIESKLPLGYEYLGEQTVKNIAKPVGAYSVTMEPRVTVAGKPKEALAAVRRMPVFVGAAAALALVLTAGIWYFYSRSVRPLLETASVEEMAFPLPDKPSIAVVAFANMSDDPKQEYFSDGISENIITALSKVRSMFVIARNSSFFYKGKSVKVKQIAEELGVRFVLEGSVQKTGDRVRIFAQLIDSLTGKHLWAERYDRNLEDIFSIQDEITKEIITALQVELTEGADARIFARGTDNHDAYLKLLQARKLYFLATRENTVILKRLAEETISLDPNYPHAYMILAKAHVNDMFFKSTRSPEESRAKAIQNVQKAIALDDSNAVAHAFLGFLYTILGKYDEAVAHCDKAITLEPNSAEAHAWSGWTFRYASLHEKAIQAFNQAVRLDPIPKALYFRGLTGSYSFLGRHEEAISAGRNAVQADPSDPLTHLNLAAAYNIAGREKKARAEAAEVVRIDPTFSLGNYEKQFNAYRNPEDKELHIGALRKAGLK